MLIQSSLSWLLVILVAGFFCSLPARALDTCTSFEAIVDGSVASHFAAYGIAPVGTGSIVRGTLILDTDEEGEEVENTESYANPAINLTIEVGEAEATGGRRLLETHRSSIWVTDNAPGQGADRVIIETVLTFDPENPESGVVLAFLTFEDSTGQALDDTSIPSPLSVSAFDRREVELRGLPGDARSLLLLALMQSGEVCTVPNSSFRRGDINDDGRVDIADPMRLFGFLFLGVARPSCQRAADANDSGSIDLSDGVWVLNHLFLGGPAPAAPFEACGTDSTPDVLDCTLFSSCDDAV